MKKIFITSSGTDIGKTLVTCALTKALKTSKKSVYTIKPVISGFNPNIVPNDLFYICEALGLNYLVDRKKLNFASFKKPMSPDMAARTEKRTEIDYKKLKDYCDNPTSTKPHYLLVETVGGVMVPINSKKTFLDLIIDSADKVILVLGSYLGSLNHSLSSYKILQDSGKKPNLIIITQNLAKSDSLYIPLNETIKSLEKFISTPIISVEKLAGPETQKINRLAHKLNDEAIYKILGS